MNKLKKKNLILALLLGGVLATVGFALWVHPFLAVTHRIPADVLVVEGWVPEEVLQEAAREFKTGRYSHVLVSGMQAEAAPAAALEHHATRAFKRLGELGVPGDQLLLCPSPYSTTHRTANTARGVRQKIVDAGLKPNGINLVSGGPHSRQSWLAYRRILADVSPVGVIAVRKGHYNPSAWWMSRQGLSWVLKDFAGWLKEFTIGPRS